MKYFSLLLFISLIFSSCFSPSVVQTPTVQKNQFKDKYQKFLEDDAVLAKSGYHFTIENITDQNKQIHKIYHPDLLVKTEQTTYDRKTKMKDGFYGNWLDDGSVRRKGHYKNDQKVGEWQEFSSKGNYKNNLKDGLWKTYDDNNQVLRETTYSNGEQVGESVEYDLNDKISLEDQIESETNENPELFKIVETMPRFPGCEDQFDDEKEIKRCADTKMLQYIYKNIRYPAIAREHGIEGMALYQFVIDRDGSVGELVKISGLCKEIEAECESIIKNMPKWRPGTQKGEPVRVQFTLPIKFRLE